MYFCRNIRLYTIYDVNLFEFCRHLPDFSGFWWVRYIKKMRVFPTNCILSSKRINFKGGNLYCSKKCLLAFGKIGSPRHTVWLYKLDSDSLALLNSITFWLVWAEIKCTVHVGLLNGPWTVQKSRQYRVGHMSLNDFWRLPWGHGLIQIKNLLIKKLLRHIPFKDYKTDLW